MDSSLVVSMIVGFISIAVALMVFRASTHATRVQAQEANDEKRLAIDAEAYSRAKDIYESAIAQLTLEVSRSRAQLREFQDELSQLHQQMSALRRANSEMRAQLDALVSRSAHAAATTRET